MTRKLLGSSLVAAMLLFASTALAAGVNMSWSACFGEGTGTQNRAFACASNNGSNVLVMSFIPEGDMSLVSGNELVIDVLSATDPLPAWWEMKDAGTCRQNALSVNSSANPNDIVCVDWAAAQSTAGIGSYSIELGSIDGSLSTRHRRVKIALAVPLSALADLTAGTEYFSCNLLVSNQKTVGLGSCAGCNVQMCLVFNSLKITTNTPGGESDVTLGNAGSAGSNIVTWQGTGPDCNLVPTRNVTWGSVKSLYR